MKQHVPTQLWASLIIHEEVAALPTVGVAAPCTLDHLKQFCVPSSNSASICPVPVFLVLLEPKT